MFLDKLLVEPPPAAAKTVRRKQVTTVISLMAIQFFDMGHMGAGEGGMSYFWGVLRSFVASFGMMVS